MAKGTAEADLLKAIEGYQTEHKGSKQHEDMISQLKRVQDQVTGKDTAGMSPGKRRAMEAAGEHTMTSESRQPVGDNNRQSNEPATANRSDKVADVFGKDGRDDRMTKTAAVPSAGAIRSNLPSTGLAPGTAEARRIVADREKSRPDTKMDPDGDAGDDNKQSQPAGEGYPPAKRVGAVTAPSLKGGSSADAKRSGTQARQVAEVTVPDGVGHDPWATASAQAKKRLLAARG
jgi:hypothetical protein